MSNSYYNEWRREVLDYLYNAYGLEQDEVRNKYLAEAYQMFEDPVEAGDFIYQERISWDF